MKKGQISSIVIGEIKNLVEDQTIEISDDTAIQEIGLSSISFVKLLIFIEDEFQIEFDDEALFLEKYTAISDVVDVVYENMDA